MSGGTTTAPDDTLDDEDFVFFLKDYYRDEVLQLASRYPSGQKSLYIDYADLYRWSPDFAHDYVDNPSDAHDYLENALYNFDLPYDVDLTGANVRVTDPDGQIDRVGVGELRARHGGTYVAVEAMLDSLKGVEERAEEMAYECARCATINWEPQGRTTVTEPHECIGCERQGPFFPNFDHAVMVDQVAVKLKEPPGKSMGGGGGQEIIGYVEDDLIDVGGPNGIHDRAGEHVVVFASLEYTDAKMKGRNARPVADRYLDIKAVEFQRPGTDDVDVEEHMDDIRELAERDDVVDLLSESIAPGLYASDDLRDFLEASVLYLLGGYRKERDGMQVRGDIHILGFGDPATGKSTAAENCARISPRSEIVSGTQTTGVGLTAAATKGGFGDDSYTLEPGVLPKANGGHAIVDEIDKAAAGTTDKLHDALEKSQQIRVSKGGIKATLNTRAGMMALGNPDKGRFDKYEPIHEQFDVDPALLSRFDLVFTLTDEPDRELDRKKANRVLTTIREVGDATRGEEVEDAETERPVDLETFGAYVAYARSNIFPRLPEGEVSDRLADFYVDTRQANAGEGAPVPITLRSLEAGVRLSEASARARHSEEIELQDVERAIGLTQRAMRDVSFDPDSGSFDADHWEGATPKSQRDRIRTISEVVEMLQDEDEFENGVPLEVIVDEATEHGISEEKAEREVEKMKMKGELYEPSNGRYRR